MGSLFDYLNWRGDLSFLQSEFNEVDNMIFSLLSYIDYGGIVSESHREEDKIPIRAAVNAFFAKHPSDRELTLGLFVSKDIIKLLRAVKETKRFRNVEMKAYVNRIDLKREMQFSATTFLLDDHTAVVSYRGTDDTIVGWKENFNMSFMDEIPAQKEAVNYLQCAAEHFDGMLRLVGHSKGGNLSVYSAMHCHPTVQARLMDVWSNDGPGFGKKMLDDPSYLEIRPLIHTLVPQSSLIGMLLEHEEHYTVVKSRQKKGALQHDGFSWEVMGADFVHLQTVTPECKRVDRTLKQLIGNMSMEQREQFTDALYQLLSLNNNAQTLSDVASMKKQWLSLGKQLDPRVYKILGRALTSYINLSAKHFIDDVITKPNGKEKKMKKVCVFDLDGTLVDSMTNYANANLSILDEEGIPYGEEMIKIITPLGYTKTAEYYVRELGVQDTVENIYRRIESKLVYEYTNLIYTKPGVKEYLQKLRDEDARLFVLTASPHITTDACLKHNGIFDWFEKVWSVEEFGLTKSDPRIFADVAKQIGCKPEEVHYFDDSLIAMKNAKTAGFITYAVYDKQNEEEVAWMKRENDVYVGSFCDLNF